MRRPEPEEGNSQSDHGKHRGEAEPPIRGIDRLSVVAAYRTAVKPAPPALASELT